MLLECIQGIGGINTFVDGYLPRIYDTVKKYGGLMICDEVQTGFGRIGSKYWGFKEEGVKPDIVTLAKGIANGLPLGAVVTRREIAETVDHNVYNTTGGGNVQVRAAMEVLKAVDNEKLAENSDNVGNYLLKELSKTQ
jgi:alanine-glyoxylate transaminase/(R)-3-amino-2-methylpropionate-pyruvate transaminase